MNRCLKMVFAMAVIMGMTTVGHTGQPELVELEPLRQWTSKLISFGSENPIFPNIRQAGTEADDRANRWLTDTFEKLGLKDVRREPVPVKGWRPSEYSLTVHKGEDEVVQEAWPIFYAAFTKGGRITAEKNVTGSCNGVNP